MPAPRRLLRLLALLAAPLLLAAACGDDDDVVDDPTVREDGDDPDGGARGDTGGDADGGDGADEDAGRDQSAVLGTGGAACAVVTPADLQAHFASPFDDGEASYQAETGGEECRWSDTDGPPVKQLSVVAYTDERVQAASGRSVEELFQLHKGEATVDEELSIGDAAFRAGSTLWVLEGSTLYSFSTRADDSEEAIAGLIALAATAVGR